MKQIEKQVTITYQWWPVEFGEVVAEHVEPLEKSATDEIISMMGKGYTSGTLHDNIYMTDTDPEDGVDYKGWWSMNSKTL